MTEFIECDGCGRSIATEDAAGMLAAITGPCPSCGGRFRLAAFAPATGGQHAQPALRTGPR